MLYEALVSANKFKRGVLDTIILKDMLIRVTYGLDCHMVLAKLCYDVLCERVSTGQAYFRLCINPAGAWQNSYSNYQP